MRASCRRERPGTSPPPGPGFGAFPASLAVFDGTNPNGTWNLYVVSQGFGRGLQQVGAMDSWSLTITTPDPPAATPAATPPPAHTCRGIAATKEGTTGDDVIEGTAGPDVIVTHAGDDRISGLEENDLVCAGAVTIRLRRRRRRRLIGGAATTAKAAAATTCSWGTLGNTLKPTGDDNCKGQAGKDKIKNCESGSR